MKEFESPRNTLRSVPGMDFVELAQNWEMTMCCGGGGDEIWAWLEAEYARYEEEGLFAEE